MSKLMIALFVVAGLGFSSVGAAQPISKVAHNQAVKDADAQHRVDKEACGALAGNAKDICLAEAKGRANVAKADADAAYENSPKTREAARVARAQARYDVAIEKCDDLAGNPKDVCVKEAKSELVKGKANAKVDRVTADTNKDAAVKQTEARKDATVEKRDADYKVAVEKCDALAGSAKELCLTNAKTQYGK